MDWVEGMTLFEWVASNQQGPGRQGPVDCQLRIANDPRVSRRHFLLQISLPRIRLCDLGSYNGTKVNGVTYRSTSSVAPGSQPPPSLAEVNLRHGDRIVIGRTVIQVRVDNAGG